MQLASIASTSGPARSERDSEWRADLAPCPSHAVLRIGHEPRRRCGAAVTASQLAWLATTSRAGAHQVGQPVDIEGLPVTGLVDRVERDGLVTRRMNPKRRRGILVQVPARGSKLHAACERDGNVPLARRLRRLESAVYSEAGLAVALIERLAGERASEERRHHLPEEPS